MYRQRESAAGSWNTACPYERVVMMRLCSWLFNPEVGVAGEVCIPLTCIMILMGADRSQESVMKQVCDGQHQCLHVRLPMPFP
jgi:hypothetical protein